MTTEDQKSREEFEACVKSTASWLDLRRYEAPHLHGAYMGEGGVEQLWQFWKASRSTYRASVLEEALEACEALRERDHDEAWQDGIGDCKDAIRALAEKPQEGQEP